MPKVSVIIPLYNKAAYVKEAIDSVLGQTWQDFEIIVTDDGSSDGSQEIVKAIEDPRLRFYQNEKNLGTAGNANKLISLSTGNYLARLDADDLMTPNRLQVQLGLMENKKEIGVSSGAIQLIGDKNETWTLPLSNTELKATVLFNTPIAQGACMMRHDLLRQQQLKYDDTGFNVAEDWLMWYKMSKVTQFANVPDVLLRYRIYDGNITHSSNHNFYASRKKVYEYMFSDLGLPQDKIDLHFYTKFFFHTPPTPESVRGFYAWTGYLKSWNAQTQCFDQVCFNKQLDSAWNRLFYFLVPHGWKNVRAYFGQTGWEKNKFMYYLKTKLSAKK